MTTMGWVQLGIYVALPVLIIKPRGLYLLRILDPALAGGRRYRHRGRADPRHHVVRQGSLVAF